MIRIESTMPMTLLMPGSSAGAPESEGGGVAVSVVPPASVTEAPPLDVLPPVDVLPSAPPPADVPPPLLLDVPPPVDVVLAGDAPEQATDTTSAGSPHFDAMPRAVGMPPSC